MDALAETHLASTTRGMKPLQGVPVERKGDLTDKDRPERLPQVCSLQSL